MFEKLTRYVTKMLTRRRRYVPALVALFVALLPQRVRAEEAVADTIELTAFDGDDGEDGSAVEEGTDDDLADEQIGEALDESSVGPEELEMAGKGGEPPRRRRAPVEIGRSRTPYPEASTYPLEKCFVMSVGSGLYYILGAGPIVLKDGRWTASEHNICIAAVAFGAGLVTLAVTQYATCGLSAVGAYAIAGAGGLFGTAVGEVLCPGPDSPPGPPPPSLPPPSPASSTPHPFEHPGLPCLCPDPGCNCGAGSGCGCAGGASYGCVCHNGGGGW